MSRRVTGTIFISIAAFLYGIRYVSAALLGSGSFDGTEEMFNVLLTSVGTKLIFFSKLSLIVGIVYLIWAEIEDNIGKIRKTLSK